MQLKIVYKSIFFLRFLIIRKYNKPVRITAMGNKKIFFSAFFENFLYASD